MSGQVDVVVPVYRDVALTRRCLESILAHHQGRLGRLILVEDASPEAGMAQLLEEIWRRSPRVILLRNERNLGFVRSANRGLLIRERDVVLINADAEATAGWLDALIAAAAAHGRAAAAVPLSNNGGLSSVPALDQATPADAFEGLELGLDLLPPFTELPTAMGFCLWMSDAALRELGAFDPVFGRGYNEENDWCQRARSKGYAILRANRAFVFHRGSASFGAERVALERRNARLLWSRYPGFLRETEAFRLTDQAQLAARHVAARMRRG